MTFDEAVDFCKNNPEIAAIIILEIDKLKEIVQEQSLEIKRLNDIISKDSTNSSKPPSTDNKFKEVKKPSTKKLKKRRGAQAGHKGKNLKLSATPDTTHILLPHNCTCCNSSLNKIKSSKVEKRQLYDLPDIKINITEYQAHSKICKKCNTINKPTFPNSVNATTQYGNNLKSFVSYCNTYQMLPYERITELIDDLVSHKISTGTISNFLNDYHNKLEQFEIDVKELLKKEEVLHSDETGVNIQGKLHWIHVASSQTFTSYMVHKKRGKVAMDDMGILSNFSSILVHDHWKSYNHYKCSHSYCNAHLLRELNGITLKDNHQWSKDMHSLLINMNNAVYDAKHNNKECISIVKKEKFTKNYEKICKNANNYYPPPDKSVKKTRGRVKQEKGKNLLDRLVKYQDETLRFLNDFRVPFTNNLAERDLRMIKVKEKISGCFASFSGGEIFCRIRSYISTLKKNKVPVLLGLKDALEGNAFLARC